MRDYKRDLEICEKATPAPWEVKLRCGFPQQIILEKEEICTLYDANFIYTAREALPYYINRVIELENQVDVLSTTVNQYVTPYYEKRAEADKLREENRKLREALEQIEELLLGIFIPDSEEWKRYCEACEIARTALRSEGK